MEYIGDIYRPPSEARSLILQVTVGCSHNKCTFCSMYKEKNFYIKDIEDIKRDIDSVRHYKNFYKKVFLADGNALVMKTEILVEIFRYIKKTFPSVTSISVYATAMDILKKTPEELKILKEEGLTIMYLGVETGSDDVLRLIKKGVNAKNTIRAGKRVVDSGIKLSTMIIIGIGGVKYTKEHAIESARVINEISPDYLGLLTLMINRGTELHRDIKEGRFELLDTMETLIENRLFIENLNVQCMLRSNHASNYVYLNGDLPDDKEKLLRELDYAIENIHLTRNENMRML